MSYANHSGHGLRPTPAVPFSAFTAPVEAVVQSAYTLFERAAKAVGAAFAGIARAMRRHRARSQLAALNDRTLQDIGVSRSEIRYLARRAAEQPGADPRFGGF